MEEGREPTEKEAMKGEVPAAVSAATETLPSTKFVKVEKNLASLGFFTPSSKRLRNAQEKSFTLTTIVNGQRVELKGTIIPSVKYGLPITADLDKWIALSKILTDIIRKEGRVTNPVSFTSAEILRLLNQHRHSGKNYREVEEWLDVLFTTTIFSEGVVYLANEKRRVKDRYRVFEQAVSFGKELPGGRIAEKNYVWFSDWQLQNINNNHLLPIDLEAYRELKNHIAKALVPLLQVWLYATRKDGLFEKRYDELCDFLNIRRYRYHSLIVQTLGPSLDELKQFGYLADWKIEKTSDGDGYKVVFYHGEKFHRDRRARLQRAQGNSATNQETLPLISVTATATERAGEAAARFAVAIDPELLAEFTRPGRDIAEDVARDLIANRKPGQDVVAQLEMADADIKRSTDPIRNPAGYRVSYVRRNISTEGFETNAMRRTRQEREAEERAQREAADARQALEDDYENFCDAEIDRYVAAHAAEFETLKNTRWEEDRVKYSFATESIAKMAARNEVRKRLDLPSLEDFFAQRKAGALSSDALNGHRRAHKRWWKARPGRTK